MKELRNCPTIRKPQTTSLRNTLWDERCRFRPLKIDGKRVVIRLTYNCDLACPHCLVGTMDFGPELRIDAWRRILSELHDINAKKVLLTGGEPLLHPDLKEIIRTISLMNIPVDLNSNLYNMTKEFMFKLHDFGLTEISVSIEGPEDIHDRMHGSAGAFTQLIQAIRWAADLGIKIDASCCITADNFTHIPQLIRLIEYLPIQSMTFSRILPIGHGGSIRHSVPQDQLLKVYEEITHHFIHKSNVPLRIVGFLNSPTHDNCLRGKSLIGITPLGEVVACVLTSDNPSAIPHPLDVGLSASVAILNRKLNEKNYDLCWSLN